MIATGVLWMAFTGLCTWKAYAPNDTYEVWQMGLFFFPIGLFPIGFGLLGPARRSIGAMSLVGLLGLLAPIAFLRGGVEGLLLVAPLFPALGVWLWWFGRKQRAADRPTPRPGPPT
ncbi:MAG TPA: hypothetical protein VIO94_12260 [Phenylobacterium sp.]